MTEYPEKGEYIAVNLSPTEGHEQQGYRPVLVISEDELNKKGMVVVVPITTNQKGPGRYLIPSGEPVKGAVLFTQLRTLDWEARSYLSKGRASDEVLEEVLGRVASILGI
ncbi:type II toxin-antitoxin system PemK/MazF family toxin [Desulfovibrio piger]|nr:type II toxin-antitoxin system PemK/MazF family toxin [Desulfovibrio piger]